MNYNAYPSWYTEALETSEGNIVPVHTPDPTAAGVTYRSSPASTARKLAYDDIVVSSTKISDDANEQVEEVRVHPPSPPASSERRSGRSGTKEHAKVDNHMSTKVMRATSAHAHDYVHERGLHAGEAPNVQHAHAKVDDHMSTKVMQTTRAAHEHHEEKNSQSKTIMRDAGNDDPRESARRGTYFGLCKFRISFYFFILDVSFFFFTRHRLSAHMHHSFLHMLSFFFPPQTTSNRHPRASKKAADAW